jgi:two-component system nitrate/nitrite response regulator NarL
LIRVRIEASAAVARAGFESVLEGNQGIMLVDSAFDADVILRDDLPGILDGHIPFVVLCDEPLTPALLRRGVHSALPRDASPDQIAAAIYAAAAGLATIPADAAQAVLVAEREFEGEPLTPREIEVLEIVAEGLSNKQIAARLNISEHTAKFHVNSILGKLAAGTRAEAVTRGLRRGLLKV